MSEDDGVVYLVGAGPGDPGLITVRGRDLLMSCDAIATDALANPALVAAACAGNAAIEVYEVGKRGGDERSATQDDINALLVRLAREGKRVVRLKGGDPLVFGRGSEEAQALAAAGVRFEIVPGITSGVGAPAYAGIPVTHRGVATSVTFVTGHEDPAKGDLQTDWAALARAGGTIVLYMGVKTLPRIAEALVAGGMSPDTPAASIQWGTHASQRTVTATLATLPAAIAAATLTAPVITVIGHVVSLRDHIAWLERRPLFGRRIVVTRASAQADGLRAALAEAGADVLELPALRVEPVDGHILREELERLGEYDWVVFTSQNAVRIVWDTMLEIGMDARSFAGRKIACVGRATADALLRRGITADVIPLRYVAEGVLQAMVERDDVSGSRILYLAAEDARAVLTEGLRDIGAHVDVVRVYRSVPTNTESADVLAALEGGEVDAVIFAAASAVRGFVQAVGPDAARRAGAVSIGAITSAAIRDAGITVLAEAEQAGIGSLVQATIRACSARP